MFQPVPPPYRPILIALTVAWAGLYVVGMITGKLNTERTRRLPQWGRFGMVAVVLACGAMGWLTLSRGTPASRYAMWIFLGLVAGAAGDVFLGDVLPLKKPVIFGILAFSVGHIFYLLALFTVRASLGRQDTSTLIGAIAAGVILAALLWLSMVRNPAIGPVLNYGSLVYAMLLVATTAISLELALATGRMVVLAAGLVLFTISDLILAQNLIRQSSFPYIRDVVWIIYSSGQLLIAFSIEAALAL